MHLFDKSRPHLANSRPTWIRDHIAIPHLEIFPLEDGNLSLSIWLPVKDSAFASMRFTKTISPTYLHGFIQNFINDPEETCEFMFKTSSESLDDNLSPNLRNPTRIEYNPDNTKLKKEIRESFDLSELSI